MDEPESMRSRELERVFELSSFFERVWRRNYMELYFSFEVLTRGFERKDLRELLALFLKEKRAKWGENSDLCGFMGNRGVKSFLDVLVAWESQRRDEVELVHCMTSQVLVFGFVNMHETLALCVEFPLVACVGGISTITTHASHLIKTPTMYVIT